MNMLSRQHRRTRTRWHAHAWAAPLRIYSEASSLPNLLNPFHLLTAAKQHPLKTTHKTTRMATHTSMRQRTLTHTHSGAQKTSEKEKKEAVLLWAHSLVVVLMR